MIDILNNEDKDILEVEFIETFTQSDLDHLVPVVEKHIAEVTQPRMLIILQDFGGWDKAKTFWEDVKLDTKYLNKFDKVALVGDKKWEEWSTKFSNLLVPNEIRFFDPAQERKAHRWLKEAK